MALVVVHQFGTYKRGDKITDAAEVAKILASANVHSVVKVADTKDADNA